MFTLYCIPQSITSTYHTKHAFSALYNFNQHYIPDTYTFAGSYVVGKWPVAVASGQWPMIAACTASVFSHVNDESSKATKRRVWLYNSFFSLSFTIHSIVVVFLIFLLRQVSRSNQNSCLMDKHLKLSKKLFRILAPCFWACCWNLKRFFLIHHPHHSTSIGKKIKKIKNRCFGILNYTISNDVF